MAPPGRWPSPLSHVRVALAAPKRDRECVADGVARPIVVGMGVRQRVRAYATPGQLTEDAPMGKLGARVDEDIADQVDVDRVARPAREPEYVGAKLLDGEAYVPTRSRAPSTPSFWAQCAQQ